MILTLKIGRWRFSDARAPDTIVGTIDMITCKRGRGINDLYVFKGMCLRAGHQGCKCWTKPRQMFASEVLTDSAAFIREFLES